VDRYKREKHHHGFSLHFYFGFQKKKELFFEQYNSKCSSRHWKQTEDNFFYPQVNKWVFDYQNYRDISVKNTPAFSLK
jgi:hypothetical protein